MEFRPSLIINAQKRISAPPGYVLFFSGSYSIHSVHSQCDPICIGRKTILYTGHNNDAMCCREWDRICLVAQTHTMKPGWIGHHFLNHCFPQFISKYQQHLLHYIMSGYKKGNTCITLLILLIVGLGLFWVISSCFDKKHIYKSKHAGASYYRHNNKYNIQKRRRQNGFRFPRNRMRPPLSEDCICTFEFDPVCDPDTGVQYSNLCFAECAGVTNPVPCDGIQDSGAEYIIDGELPWYYFR